MDPIGQLLFSPLTVALLTSVASAVVATAFYAWRPGVLGPLLAGLAAYLPLRLAWGW